MKYNYCTMFDKNYIYIGLSLYNSLDRHGHNFKLWVLCMDDVVYNLLLKMNLQHMDLVNLPSIEDKQLKKIKRDRGPGEYAWTCKAPLFEYLFNEFTEVESLCYLDADCYIFSSPEFLFEELGDNSIMIAPHKFSNNNKKLERNSGIYNAGFIIFKNDEDSLKCLKWWKDRCIEWCYKKRNNNRMGDQMYIDNWPKMFHGVKVTYHKGIDVAPWNIRQYKIIKKNNQIFIDEDSLIFYHFHTFKLYSESNFEISSYPSYLSKDVKKYIYTTYQEALRQSIGMVKKVDNNFSYGFSTQSGISKIIIKIKKIIKIVMFRFGIC